MEPIRMTAAAYDGLPASVRKNLNGKNYLLIGNELRLAMIGIKPSDGNAEEWRPVAIVKAAR